MGLSFFIAKRIYSDREQKKNVSKPAIQIAISGIAIGLAVMIVSVCVVLGFKHTIRDKVMGMGNHITVSNFHTIYANELRPICISDSLVANLRQVDGIKHIQKFVTTQGIIKTEDNFMGVAIKGIDEEYDTTFIHNSLKEGHIPSFSGDKSSNKIVISKWIADKLNISLGDRIFLYFIAENVKVRRFTVEGIYETNMTQFDKLLCITDIYTTTRLNGWEKDQCEGAEIIVNNPQNILETESKIVDNINKITDRKGESFASINIFDAYPQIFSWLNLLDMNVWIILILMLCVAGFTMIAGLLIIILERTSMIGTLKALGASNKNIRHIFLWFSVFIIAKGIIIGDIIGIGIIALQHYTGIIKLDPSTYYVDIVPVEFNIHLIALLNIATLLICTLVLIAPSYLVAHISPTKTMKFG